MKTAIKDIVFVNAPRHDAGYVIRICAVAALGGILFGYDTSVIAGAITPLQNFFHLSPAQTGWAVSNVVIGCIIGALLSGWLADRWGRRMTLFVCAILFSAQSIGTAVAPSFSFFVIFRILGGIAVGAASMVSPMYMSEVSPKDMRGRALSMEQFAIVFGQVIVFIVNYMIAANATPYWLNHVGWRWMFASEIVPCIIFCLTVFTIPESPRWHALKGRDDLALKTLSRISNAQHARNLMAEIKDSLRSVEDRASFHLGTVLKDRRAMWIIFVASMIAALQQFTGINVMMYYAPMVLHGVGGSMQSALFQTVWIGVALLLGSVVGAWLIDFKGRRFLLKYGALCMVASLILVSMALYHQTQGYGALAGMMLFMFTFGCSWGPITWVLISEVFPNRFRSIGMSIAVASNWIGNFFVSQFFPMVNENKYLTEHFHGAFSMWLFAILGLLSTWFVLRFVPETRGVSLEKIEDTMLQVAPASVR